MVLDGFVSLHESLVQAKPKHPPKLEDVTLRESSALSTDPSEAKKPDTNGHYKAALAIFGLAILLLVLLRVRRSKLNSSHVGIKTPRKLRQEALPV